MPRMFFLTQIELDFGAVKCLPHECVSAVIKRPLLMTDPGVRAAGLLDRALMALGGRNHSAFDQTRSNPTDRFE